MNVTPTRKRTAVWAVDEDAARLAQASPDEILRWGLERFGERLAIISSFQIDGMALIDMASRIDPRVRIITIDTGRLPAETHDLMERVRDRYGIEIEVFTPDLAELQPFLRTNGTNAFYRSISLRFQCCDIRKVAPLERALQTVEAWVSGQRRDQTQSRAGVAAVEPDPQRPGLVKLNPLAHWTENQVWAYIREHDVPYNGLFDRGYASIGCAPCTRAIQPGEDARAGRWWWEADAPKECGIHFDPSAHLAASERSGTSSGPARVSTNLAARRPQSNSAEVEPLAMIMRLEVAQVLSVHSADAASRIERKD